MNYWIWVAVLIANAYGVVTVYTGARTWAYFRQSILEAPEFAEVTSWWRLRVTLFMLSAYAGLLWPVTLRRLYWAGGHD